MASEELQKKIVITGAFTANFVYVFKPQTFAVKAGEQPKEPKYSLTMTFDKDDPALKDLKRAANFAMIEKFGPDKSKWPKKWNSPFGDGDEHPEWQGFAGKTYVKATSTTMPGLVDRNRKEIIDEKLFYSGCKARAEVIAFAYDMAGNRGASFSLQNVQKIADGEPLSGKRAAKDVFSALEAEDDDEFGLEDDVETAEDGFGGPADEVRQPAFAAKKKAPVDDDADLW